MDGVQDLEMRCERPGTWLIEGVRVRRWQQYGLGTWWVITWGAKSEQVPTLAEAKRRIVDAINRGDI